MPQIFVNLGGKDKLSDNKECKIPFRSTLFVKLYSILAEIQSEDVKPFDNVDTILDDLSNTDVLYDTAERKILGYLNYRITDRSITIKKFGAFADIGSYIIKYLKDKFDSIRILGSGREGIFLFILEGFVISRCSYGETFIWNKS